MCMDAERLVNVIFFTYVIHYLVQLKPLNRNQTVQGEKENSHLKFLWRSGVIL